MCFERVKTEGKKRREEKGREDEKGIEGEKEDEGEKEWEEVSVGVVVKRDVAEGEELLIDYGPIFWEE